MLIPIIFLMLGSLGNHLVESPAFGTFLPDHCLEGDGESF